MRRETQEFSCPVCYSQYDNRNRKPMLVCTQQHILCLQCVTRLCGGVNREDALIRCPICRQEVRGRNIVNFVWYHRWREMTESFRNRNTELERQNQEFIDREREHQNLANLIINVSDQSKQIQALMKQTQEAMFKEVKSLRYDLKDVNTKNQTVAKNMMNQISVRIKQDLKRQMELQANKMMGQFRQNRQFFDGIKNKMDAIDVRCSQSQKWLKGQLDGKINQATELIGQQKQKNHQFRNQMRRKVGNIIICAETSEETKKQINGKMNKSLELMDNIRKRSIQFEALAHSKLTKIEQLSLEASNGWSKKIIQKIDVSIEQAKKEDQKLRVAVQKNMETIESLHEKASEQMQNLMIQQIDECSRLAEQEKENTKNMVSHLNEEIDLNVSQPLQLLLQQQQESKQFEFFMKNRMNAFQKEHSQFNEQLFNRIRELEKMVGKIKDNYIADKIGLKSRSLSRKSKIFQKYERVNIVRQSKDEKNCTNSCSPVESIAVGSPCELQSKVMFEQNSQDSIENNPQKGSQFKEESLQFQQNVVNKGFKFYGSLDQTVLQRLHLEKKEKLVNIFRMQKIKGSLTVPRNNAQMHDNEHIFSDEKEISVSFKKVQNYL